MFSSNASQVSTAANYIEDVFSTYLYTGTGASQTITNGIDLSTKGGMVWFKSRSAATSNVVADTSRGISSYLITNDTLAAQPYSILTSFNTNGFTIPASPVAPVNTSPDTYTSWTFRKQAKFFDVVTYTGDGVAGRTVAHNLGSAPGCMIVKRTDGATNWRVYHRSLGATQYLDLDETVAAGTATTIWNDTAPTATVFSVGTNSGVNANGGTYVAYLFAHDAGGFGAAGTDNVISCGSFTTSASGYSSINLGWEPQWVLIKTTGSVQNWFIFDNMRGFPVTGNSPSLSPNLSSAEDTTVVDAIRPTATVFDINADYFGGNRAYIYIAIRRGPMKTPTSGTSVFSPILSSAGSGTNLTTNFPVDLQITGRTAGTTATTKGLVFDRLRGVSTTTTGSGQRIQTHSTAAETALTNGTLNWGSTGFQMPGLLGAASSIFWNFRRAPGFFDEVCYTGNDLSRNLNHNLGVAPQLWIIKARSTAVDWSVGSSLLSSTTNDYLALNLTDAKASLSNFWNTPTATTFGFGSGLPSASNINASGITYVAYLFATLTGVSKVGSYTGTAALQTIDCGFSAGARFVLIKRTDSTGDWYVWDSARGISSGNDPYILLNSTAAEVTGTNYVDTTSVGFQVTAAAPAGINASGGSYLFLAVS